MNCYLLDTNACIAMAKRNAGVWGRIRLPSDRNAIRGTGR